MMRKSEEVITQSSHSDLLTKCWRAAIAALPTTALSVIRVADTLSAGLSTATWTVEKLAVFSRARGQSWWTRCKDAHGHCPHMDMVCCSLGTDAQLGLSLIIVDVHPYGIAPVVAHGIWNCGLRRVLGSGIRQAIMTITCRRCFACASLSPSPSFTSFPIGLSVETLTDLSLLVVSTLVHPRRSWNSAWNSRT